MGLLFGAIILVYLVNKSVKMDGVLAGKGTMPLGIPETSISGSMTTCVFPESKLTNEIRKSVINNKKISLVHFIITS